LDKKLEQKLSEARFIHASENVIYPLIDSLISDRLEQSCGRFRSGQTEFISDIAYIAGLKDLQDYLKRTQAQGNKILETIHGIKEELTIPKSF
jgi:hypothetical protein